MLWFQVRVLVGPPEIRSHLYKVRTSIYKVRRQYIVKSFKSPLANERLRLASKSRNEEFKAFKAVDEVHAWALPHTRPTGMILLLISSPAALQYSTVSQ